jgi:hypothetical protein
MPEEDTLEIIGVKGNVVNAKMKATAEYRWTYLPIDFSDLRGSNGWNSVHPRAFRSDLFLRNITRELFYYKRWIIPTAADVVWWTLILESLQNPEDTYGFIDQYLYHYNDQLPTNDHRGDENKLIQNAFREYLLKVLPKPKYLL